MDDVELTAARLARLLRSGDGGLAAPTRSDLLFVDEPELVPLELGSPPPDAWAADGGQALVADARCFQVAATRAARVRWVGGRSTLEDEGDLRVHLLGAGGEAGALIARGAPLDPGVAVDINLLREWGEWEQVARCVTDCRPGGLVLVDGDLQPDWRLPPDWVAGLLETAVDRFVGLVGVTKHSSLTRGGAPLLGWLEQEAEVILGPRARWWARVATTEPDSGPGLDVVVARLDPDARFAFRVDVPGGLDVAAVLGQLATLADDAAFPGYPYPLAVADRVAACGSWVRHEVWDRLDGELDRLGVPGEVRERAFSDRHRLMERA